MERTAPKTAEALGQGNKVVSIASKVVDEPDNEKFFEPAAEKDAATTEKSATEKADAENRISLLEKSV